MKKVYKGTVEGDIIRLEKQIGLPVGTQILVMLKNILQGRTRRNKRQTDETP